MKQFDLGQVGKRMPYSVPDGFFDKLEENVMEEVRGQKKDIRVETGHKKALVIALRSALAVAAAVTLFFAVEPLLPRHDADDFEATELAFNNLSTDDQEFLIQVYEDEEYYY